MPTLDFSADQAVFDNLEAVLYTSVRNSGNVSVHVVDATFIDGGSSEGAPSYGVYTKGGASFTIRAGALRQVGGCKPRDAITRGDGTVFTVLGADPGGISNVWNIDTVNLVLAADLAQTGVLSRPTNAQDATGRASLATYAVVGGTVNCRLQPEGGNAGDTFERRTTPKRFTAHLETSLNAQAKDRFTVDGQAYTVLEEQQPERLDELPRLILEEVL